MATGGMPALRAGLLRPGGQRVGGPAGRRPGRSAGRHRARWCAPGSPVAPGGSGVRRRPAGSRRPRPPVARGGVHRDRPAARRGRRHQQRAGGGGRPHQGEQEQPGQGGRPARPAGPGPGGPGRGRPPPAAAEACVRRGRTASGVAGMPPPRDSLAAAARPSCRARSSGGCSVASRPASAGSAFAGRCRGPLRPARVSAPATWRPAAPRRAGRSGGGGAMLGAGAVGGRPSAQPGPAGAGRPCRAPVARRVRRAARPAAGVGTVDLPRRPPPVEYHPCPACRQARSYSCGMPRYEFRCRACGDTFEVNRPMAEAGEPAVLPAGTRRHGQAALHCGRHRSGWRSAGRRCGPLPVAAAAAAPLRLLTVRCRRAAAARRASTVPTCRLRRAIRSGTLGRDIRPTVLTMRDGADHRAA